MGTSFNDRGVKLRENTKEELQTQYLQKGKSVEAGAIFIGLMNSDGVFDRVEIIEEE